LTYPGENVLVLMVGIKPGAWVPTSMEDVKMRKMCGALALVALLAASAPVSAQITNYPGMCTGYTTSGECFGCCARLAKGNPECTNACKMAFPRASLTKATTTPKRK